MASLAVFITAVYVGIAVGIGTLVGSGGKPNLALSILAQAIVAIGFQPVRERVQKVANRLVYGRTGDSVRGAERVLGAGGRDLCGGRGAAADGAGAPGGGRARSRPRCGCAATPSCARRRPTRRAPALSAVPLPMSNGTLPALVDATRAVEVRYQGELLGALSVSKRRGEGLTPIEEKLVDDLAHQAGLVLKNVGLSADLQARLDELRASRQQLVGAQDMERRRLERNLHDGARQHLVALKVKLGLAEMLLGKGPGEGGGDPGAAQGGCGRSPRDSCETWLAESTRPCSPIRGWWLPWNRKRARRRCPSTSTPRWRWSIHAGDRSCTLYFCTSWKHSRMSKSTLRRRRLWCVCVRAPIPLR